MYFCTFVNFFYVYFDMRGRRRARTGGEECRPGGGKRIRCCLVCEPEESKEKHDTTVSTDHGKQVPQWLAGPEESDVVISIGAPDRMDNYTWEGNDFTGRFRRHRHLQGRILEAPEDQFRKPAVLYPLGSPEQFQVLVAHEVVVRMGRVHIGLRKRAGAYP
jgi:hypothetical protein